MLTTNQKLRAIFSGSIGNLVEWYDWYTYSVFSLYFAPLFFPSENPTISLLNTAGIFAVGFLVRPIGGWLMGRMADRKGRKFAMTFSVLLMSFGSLLIAILPTYQSIGFLAPLGLLFARLIQGLSVGGEYGTSATYLSEMAEPSRRGFYSSFQYVTLIGGQLLALIVQIVLQKLLFSPEELTNWAWRIPFFIGAIFAFSALYLRAHMKESPMFAESKNKNLGSLKILIRYPKSFFLVFGLTAGGTAAFYTYTTYLQKYLVNTLGLSKSDSSTLSFFSLFIFAAIQPLFGHLSDKIGRKPLLIGFGILGTLGTVPLIYAINIANSESEIFIWMLVALIIVSGYTSINAIVKAELFPTYIRALGVGFPYAIAVAIFGGTAEYFALYFKSIENEWGYYWYVSGLIFLSTIVYVLLPNNLKTTKLK
ncbi:MAG: hypothetical protein RIR51_502 [Bacteroidota bacterium]